MGCKQSHDVAIYIGHFRSEHAKLCSITDDLHRRILSVTMLSALAQGRYPCPRSNSEQFTLFIEHYASWADATSISIASLKTAEQRNPQLSCGFLAELSLRYDSWRARAGTVLDPKPDDILPLNTTAEDRKRVDRFRHSALLWVYRNKLVHEYRKPGHGMDFSENDTPFYHTLLHMDGEGSVQRETVELVYPAGWLVGSIPPCLARLETYYLESGTNPYNSYTFGSPWRG